MGLFIRKEAAVWTEFDKLVEQLILLLSHSSMKIHNQSLIKYIGLCPIIMKWGLYMSDSNERKKYFNRLANQFVKKQIRKREVQKMSFEEMELAEVRSLKEFLLNVVADNTEPMLLECEGHNRYIGVSFKVSIGEKLSTFVNVFYNVKDLEYKKDELYVPKSIYRLCQNRHIEAFFCTSLLRIKNKNEYGFYAPARRTENASSVSTVYIDLDLPVKLRDKGTEELLNMLKAEYYEVFHYLGGIVVSSGGGFHVYFMIETVSLESEELKKHWKMVQSDMALLFNSFGADLKCVGDVVRILRMPGLI